VAENAVRGLSGSSPGAVRGGGFIIAKWDIAALLALAAALISGVGDVIRQRSAQEISDEQVGHVELLRMSLRDMQWWLGGGAAVVSAALQAVALGLGSVVLVQALQVTALLFALPVYAWLTREGLTRREVGWAVLLACAVAVFVTVGDPAAGCQRASIQAWAVVALVIGPAMAFCVLGARIWSGPVAAVLLAVVSASSWAMFAVFTKALVDVVDQGAGALLRTPELYGWLLVAVLGTVFQQSSFRASSLTASLPTMTVTEPVVASLLGVTVLGETLSADGPELFALAAAVVAVIVATAALARGEAAYMAADDERRVTTGRVPVTAPEVQTPVAAVATGRA
jgi:drug/metabolite transporter (DMT)-like permease